MYTKFRLCHVIDIENELETVRKPNHKGGDGPRLIRYRRECLINNEILT